MVNLAKNSAGAPLSLSEISEQENISPKYLEQITLPLTRAKLLSSTRGTHGGYALAKKPEEYTVKEILAATETTLAPVSCLENARNACLRKTSCPTLPVWEGLAKVIDDYLSGIKLSDLVERDVSAFPN